MRVTGRGETPPEMPIGLAAWATAVILMRCDIPEIRESLCRRML